MKKMLILTLLLGMTSVASAGIVVVATPPAQTDGSIETDPIGDVVPMQAHFVGVVGAAVTPTLLYGGNLGEFTDYTGADQDLTDAVDYWIGEYAAATAGFDGGASSQIFFGAYYDSQDPPVEVVGQLVTLAGSGVAEIYLLDADLATGVYSAAKLVPEPMTLGLLGLGGLFLRRRK